MGVLHHLPGAMLPADGQLAETDVCEFPAKGSHTTKAQLFIDNSDPHVGGRACQQPCGLG